VAPPRFSDDSGDDNGTMDSGMVGLKRGLLIAYLVFGNLIVIGVTVAVCRRTPERPQGGQEHHGMNLRELADDCPDEG